MHKKNWKLVIIQFAVIAAIILSDQLVKLWIVEGVEYRSGFSVIDGVFSIYHTVNTGAAWSMLAGKTLVLIIIPAVAAVAMIYALLSKKFLSKPGTWAISLILAGALGNLIDRIFRDGKVVDMFRFDFIDFPVFNVADISITIGAILFFVYILFFYDNKSEKQK